VRSGVDLANFFKLKSGYDDKLSFINIYKATIVATCLLPSKCIWLQDCWNHKYIWLHNASTKR